MGKTQIASYSSFLLLKSFKMTNGSGLEPENLTLIPEQASKINQGNKGEINNVASLLPATEDNPWFLIGASVTGNGHKATGTPCQDSHKMEVWGKGWGVAIVADGAGSAEKSHYASSFVAQESAKQALSLVKSKKWMDAEALPDEEEWNREARMLMVKIQEALKGYAENLECSVQELHTTLILVIFSPFGLLVVHVGDGRAGCINKEDNHQSIITPMEGEQVGETVFVTMDFEMHKEMIETRIIKKSVEAFFLLSDGCERACWETVQKNEKTNKYYKPNRPFVPFFRHTITTLESMQHQETVEQLMESWYNYLDKGHKGFQTETDDKTMLIGIWMNPNNK